MEKVLLLRSGLIFEISNLSRNNSSRLEVKCEEDTMEELSGEGICPVSWQGGTTKLINFDTNFYDFALQSKKKNLFPFASYGAFVFLHHFNYNNQLITCFFAAPQF